MALDRWAKLREVERYQLQIAERYYKQQNWKAALAEYEKFVTLYERSEGAPYAQLKWGLCQVQLRQGQHGDQGRLPIGDRLLARLARRDPGPLLHRPHLQGHGPGRQGEEGLPGPAARTTCSTPWQPTRWAT